MVVVLPWVPATTIGGVAGNEKVFENCGIEQYGDLFVEDVFEFGISARDRVADDAKVRRRLQIFCAKTFIPGDAERIQQSRGGRIDVDVRAGDMKTALFQHACHGRHGGAADAKQDECGQTAWQYDFRA